MNSTVCISKTYELSVNFLVFRVSDILFLVLSNKMYHYNSFCLLQILIIKDPIQHLFVCRLTSITIFAVLYYFFDFYKSVQNIYTLLIR